MRSRIFGAVAAVLALQIVSGLAAVAAELRKVTLGVLPIVDVAPAYLGKSKGFFEKHGLDLTIQTGQGGAALLPSVVSGQFQFGFSNLISLFIAQSRGLPLRVVAAGVSSTGKQGADFSAIVVPSGSPAKTARDLEGKSVAVNTLQNMGEVSIAASVRAAGGDPKKVKYVEVAFPDVPAALANNRIDAAWMVEPFVTIAKDGGATAIASNFVDTAPGMMVSGYFTSAKYAEAEPDLVRSFVAALNESFAYADAHPDEVRAITGTYTRIPADVAARMVLPAWPTAIDRKSTEAVADATVAAGLIPRRPDLAKLMP